MPHSVKILGAKKLKHLKVKKVKVAILVIALLP